jgi:hypothetical protein
MKICPYCSHHNLEGIFLCEECGQVLYSEGATSISTKRIHGTNPTNLFAAPVAMPEQVEEGPEPAIATAGAVQFAAGSAIVIHINDQRNRLYCSDRRTRRSGPIRWFEQGCPYRRSDTLRRLREVCRESCHHPPC